MLSRLAEGDSVVFYLRDGTELQYSVAELAYISGMLRKNCRQTTGI